MELARKRDIPQYHYTSGDLAEDISDLTSQGLRP
jgi:hypothetical protein